MVDDGSPEDCRSFLDSYTDTDSRVMTIHNGGVSSARNVGIKDAKGKYITFIDAVDYVTQDYLCNLYSGICNNDVDLAKPSCIHYKDGEKDKL